MCRVNSAKCLQSLLTPAASRATASHMVACTHGRLRGSLGVGGIAELCVMFIYSQLRVCVNQAYVRLDVCIVTDREDR